MFILAIIIYGATPHLNEIVILNEYRSMYECRERKEETFAKLAYTYDSKDFEVVCYRNPKDTA